MNIDQNGGKWVKVDKNEWKIDQNGWVLMKMDDFFFVELMVIMVVVICPHPQMVVKCDEMWLNGGDGDEMWCDGGGDGDMSTSPIIWWTLIQID